MQKCPFCLKNTLVKNGRKNGRQRYKCSQCKRYRPQNERPDNRLLLYQYIHHKQTCSHLAQHHHCRIKTIRRRIR
ncbi:transposase-like zinc-binding domain-containing protein [Neisseria lisongii]|uniref:transposase-like zinc-binding domain-containing protein n=1 Tax=Neisseria lisongii TaxID=2912188 RepID=UPI003FCD3E90